MASRPSSLDRTARRMALVEEHVRCENAHDLEGVLRTFGDEAQYEDQPWKEHFRGLDEVRSFYQQIMLALPDLQIEILRCHPSDDTILLEVLIRGTHRGPWRGLPPTGIRVEFPLCGVYTFTADDRLAGERIYYDRATILRQLGLFREPQTLAGRVEALLAHPWTLLRSFVRNLLP